MQYRVVPLDEARLVATALPAGSHLVRVHPREGADYDRLIVVTEQDEGRTLLLFGWIGRPLTPREWRAAAAALFPNAQIVCFERRTHGRSRLSEVRL